MWLGMLARDQMSREWFDPFGLNPGDGSGKAAAGFNQFAGHKPFRAFGSEC